MSFNNKNEIIKLFRNIQLSKFLTNPIMISNDTNANIVLSSLYMLLKRQDYPIHFDTMGTGNFVPDIVLYRCPPIYDKRIQLNNFKDIEKYLKKDTDIGNDILDAFDSLSDAAIIFSPILFGPQFLPMLDLLDVKDRLVNLGHKVYNFIAQKVEIDYIEKKHVKKVAGAKPGFVIYHTNYSMVIDADISGIRLVSDRQ